MTNIEAGFTLEPQEQPKELTGAELERAVDVQNVGPHTKEAVAAFEKSFDAGVEKFFEHRDFVEILMNANENIFRFIKEQNIHTVVFLDKSARFDWVVLDEFAKAEGYPLKFNFIIPDSLDFANAKKKRIAEMYPWISQAKEPILVLDEETMQVGNTVNTARHFLKKIAPVNVYAAVLGWCGGRKDTVQNDKKIKQKFLMPETVIRKEDGSRRDYSFNPNTDVLLGTSENARSQNVIMDLREKINAIQTEKNMSPQTVLLILETKREFPLSHGNLSGGISESIFGGQEGDGDKEFWMAKRGPWWAHSIARRFREGWRKETKAWLRENRNKQSTSKAA